MVPSLVEVNGNRRTERRGMGIYPVPIAKQLLIFGPEPTVPSGTNYHTTGRRWKKSKRKHCLAIVCNNSGPALGLHSVTYNSMGRTNQHDSPHKEDRTFKCIPGNHRPGNSQLDSL